MDGGQGQDVLRTVLQRDVEGGLLRTLGGGDSLGFVGSLAVPVGEAQFHLVEGSLRIGPGDIQLAVRAGGADIGDSVGLLQVEHGGFALGAVGAHSRTFRQVTFWASSRVWM